MKYFRIYLFIWRSQRMHSSLAAVKVKSKGEHVVNLEHRKNEITSAFIAML